MEDGPSELDVLQLEGSFLDSRHGIEEDSVVTSFSNNAVLDPVTHVLCSPVVESHGFQSNHNHFTCKSRFNLTLAPVYDVESHDFQSNSNHITCKSRFNLALAPLYDVSHRVQYFPGSVNHAVVPDNLCDSHVSIPCDDNSFAEYLLIHKDVVNSGRYNHAGCKISLPTRLNIASWREHLSATDYWDLEVCDLLQFGFPIGYHSSSLPTSNPRNHHNAHMFQVYVDKFICKEVELGATMGPFFHNPLHSYLYTSPLNTAPKKGSTEGDRRVILDLSWPDGFAVNDGIDKNYYLGEWVSLRYPSIDDFTDLIASLGQGCLLYKRDLSRAYRQIPVCPGDIGFLGYSWRSRFYIDTALPFGLRSAAFICQRVTNAIAHLHRWHGYNLINYLDDFGGVEKPSKANEAFAQLGTLLSDLGVQEATQKAEAPSTNIEFLGIHLAQSV